MSKVYGYCRTALVEGNNMEEQCAVVENYCKSRGMNLEKCFCDAGVSAHNMNRERLDELIDVLEDGDIIVTKDVSRFARNPEKCMAMIDKISNMGVEIVYTIDQDDTSEVEDLFKLILRR